MGVEGQGEGLMGYQEESMNIIQDILSEGVTSLQFNNLMKLSRINARGYANEHIKSNIYEENNLIFLHPDDFFIYVRPKREMSPEMIERNNRRINNR